MRIEDVPFYGQRSLQATLAGIDQLDAGRQIPVLRGVIDIALDRVAAAENAYYEFIGECAMLASQNMQDVRLDDLERRVERLENPEGPGYVDVIVEAAIIFTVEFAIIVGAPAVAGSVLTFVGARLIARSSRVNERVAMRLTSSRKYLKEKLGSMESELAKAQKTLDAAKLRFKNLGAPDAPQTIPARIALEDMANAAKDVRAATEALTTVSVELADISGGPKTEALVSAYRNALGSGIVKLKSRALRDFLKGATAQATADTFKGRLGEASGQKLADLLKDAAKHFDEPTGALQDAPFLSSNVIGDILSRLRKLRTEATKGHGQTRILLQAMDEKTFAVNQVAQELVRGIFDAIMPLEDALLLFDVVRPGIVRGFEASLWYEWLYITGSLNIDPDVSFESSLKLEFGDLHKGYLVTKVVRQPERQSRLDPDEKLIMTVGSYTGDFYHGVRKLSEHQAIYLYDTFAFAYFTIPENASSLPFKDAYDADRYAEELSLSTRTLEGLNNFERERRLDEMRVMVVIFFTAFVASLRGKVGYGAITDTTVMGDDYLSQLPKFTPPDCDQDGAEPTPEELAERLDALFEQSRSFTVLRTDLNIVSFEEQMTLLEQRLWMFELVHSQTSYESAEAPDGQTMAEAMDEIVKLQTTVSDDYTSLLKFLESYSPEAATDFKKLYEERKKKLTTSWPAMEPQPAKRRFP